MPLERRKHTANVHIKVNGSDLGDEQTKRVVSVLVEQSLHLPDMFVIRVLDVGDDSDPKHASFFKILDHDTFAIGREVQIDLAREGDPKPVVKGEITSVEMEVDQTSGPMLTIRGYDRSHRLHRGRHSRSFLNQSDGDIARKVAQEVGLQAQPDSTPTHDYVFQNNQTNWEFLRERAARHGFELFVDDRTLHFRKPQNGQQQAPEQKLWDNLLSLRVKVASLGQTSQVVVKAWNPKIKEAITGKSRDGKLEPVTGLSRNGKQTSAEFGDATVYVVNRPVESQTEADDMAQAVFDELDGSYVQAEGVCLGEPAIKPGVTVKLAQIGQRLSGQYYVTSATHSSSAHEGYRTTFVVSGRQTNSLLELVQPKSEGVAVPSVVVGIVTNNTDPDEFGRVKVKFPWLAEDESWWARIATPWAGKKEGMLFLPDVGDEVLVSFEHGDVTRPFILGALWNGKDQPPQPASIAVQNSKVSSHIIYDGQDFLIQWDSRPGEEKLSMRHQTNSTVIRIIKENDSILIKADGPVNVEAGGDVNVTAGGKANITASGDANVETGANASVKASGNANVKATGNASVEADGSLNLKGQGSVNLEAGGTMSIKAGATLTIKGAMVSIN